MFEKILIANRGEIACRIVRTARRMGIRTVAVCTGADAHALHVRLADEVAPVATSYLDAAAILDAARRTGARAIHPGYGFLSENADFAQACEDAGIVFIGPRPESIRAMGLKDGAKAVMEKAGVPVVPGYRGQSQDPAHLLEEAKKTGFPVLIKAVAGGGGKGMRRVDGADDFAPALESCRREAQAAFGNAHILIEKYIAAPRHVEVQVFGDSHGNAVHLFERDCSAQRRHQKVVEEAPAPGLPDKVRAAMGDAAVRAVRALGYENAGTIEFIMESATCKFYFMEMNTRLQVEHPVTEMITGLDLVEWQLRVAAGEELPLRQKEIKARGHAFEARLYAEDPAQEFLPQAGRIAALRFPAQARIESGVEAGDTIGIDYDPMIAKIVVHGADRDAALRAMQAALRETAVAGLKTNQEFLANMFAHHEFAGGAIDTGFIPRCAETLVPPDYARPGRTETAMAALYFLLDLGAPPHAGADPWNIRDNWRLNGPARRTFSLSCRGRTVDVAARIEGDKAILSGEDGKEYEASFIAFENAHLTVELDGIRHTAVAAGQGRDLMLVREGRAVALHLYVPGSEGEEEKGEGRILAPMPGRIVNVLVRRGDTVEKGRPLLVMEAMKMEMTVRAGCAGIVEELPVAAGAQVPDGALLAAIRAEGEAA